MAKTSLPSADVALASLRENGNQFAEVPLAPQPLGGLTFPHPEGEERQLAVDPRVLAEIGKFFTRDSELRRALRQAGGQTDTLQSGMQKLQMFFGRSRLIWGVSGFASVGFSCHIHVDRLEWLYRYLATEACRPSIVCDGGVGAGVLGASAVLAQRYNLPTLGVIPLQGLASMAPRSFMLQYGASYEERQVIVGLLPDILAIAGGGNGALDEGLTTLKYGGCVLLLDDPERSSIGWQRVPEMVKAIDDGRMIVCGAFDQIAESAEKLRAMAARNARIFRPQRWVALRAHFAA